MTLTIDSVIYSNLLTEVTPKVIESEAEYERTLAIAEQLTFNQSKTPEETAVYKLLVVLVEAYEADHYPLPKVSPNKILRHILEASGTRLEDLLGTLGSNRAVTEIVQGERKISPTQAQILANLFKVSPDLFL